MRTSQALTTLSASVALTLFASATPAHADTDAKGVSDARELATAGMQLQADKRYAECAAKFDAAHKIYPEATTVTLRLAECLAASGKMVEAGEAYRALAATPLASNAPAQFKQAQQQGKAEADELEKRVPQLTISVDPSPPPSGTQLHMQRANEGAVATVEVLDAAWIGTARRVNPGTYTVFATAPGYASKAKQLILVEGDKKTEALILSAGEQAPVLEGNKTLIAGPNEAPPPAYVVSPSAAKPTGLATKNGLMLGGGLGVFAAGGNDGSGPYGGGSGLAHLNATLRLGKFLLGGIAEYQSLPITTRGRDGVNAYYAGLQVGLLTTAEKKVAFWLDAGLGLQGADGESGLGGQLGLGPSIPLAKNIRLVIKGLLGAGSKPGGYAYLGLGADLEFEIPFGAAPATKK